MVEFAYPWIFILLPLPLVVLFWAPAYRQKQDAIQVPFLKVLADATGQTPDTGSKVARRSIFQLGLLALVWCLVITGLAGPERVGEPVERVRSARDIMVAVDLSASMAHDDFPLDDEARIPRLVAVKQVLLHFSKLREHDRLGLILFGDAPYLQAPFTDDHAVWRTLLMESEVGMAGANTALGDAIGLSIQSFRNVSSKNRVLILLTDGNDTKSRVPPVDAAKVAASYGVKIYAIAVGDPSSVGEDALDVQTLQRIADLTQGRFFQAFDQRELNDIHDTILALEPSTYDSLTFQPRSSLHHIALGAVFILLSLYWAVAGAQAAWRHRRAHGA